MKQGEAGAAPQCPFLRGTQRGGPDIPLGRSGLAPKPLARALGRRREAARQELGCGHLGPGRPSAPRSFQSSQSPIGGRPRAVLPDPKSPTDTQRHQRQKTSEAPTLARTESKPAGTTLRKQQRSGLQVPSAKPRTPDLPVSSNAFPPRAPGPRAPPPSAARRRAGSVCKQTGHVAPAARSPPPAPAAPRGTPRSHPAGPRQVQCAAFRRVEPEGPRDRCPAPGARHPH